MRPKITLPKHREWLRKAAYSLAKERIGEMIREINTSNISSKGFFAAEPSSGQTPSKYGPTGWNGAEEKQLYGLPYEEIIALRISVARIYSQQEETADIAASLKPVEVEVNVKKVRGLPIFSEYYGPYGPAVYAKGIKLCSNPKIPKVVEEIKEERIKTQEAMELLYPKYDVYYLYQLLSAGFFGEEKRKVPTRWSITATDDLVGKMCVKKILEFPMLNEWIIAKNVHLHNKWIIVFCPGAWAFENFEAWAPGSSWAAFAQSYITREHEYARGRSSYAESQAGGYYATRLAALEKLLEWRKQAKVIAFREVRSEYQIPVGVWQVRESVRRAKVIARTSCLKDALEIIRGELEIPLEQYLEKSVLIKQTRITDF